MTEKRTVFISGTPYTVTISSEQEVLSAAYAAGGAIIGLWDKNRSGQSLAPAEYVVECAEDADEEFLERVEKKASYALDHRRDGAAGDPGIHGGGCCAHDSGRCGTR